MAKKSVKIVNCKKASIRRSPWIPIHANDIVGVREGSLDDQVTVQLGKTITIDTSEICYDWTDRKFYRTLNPKGWIYEGCIDLGDTNG